MKMTWTLYLLTFIGLWKSCQNAETENFIYVNKCCEKFEIFIDRICLNANNITSDVWKPSFSDDQNKKKYPDIRYKFLIGNPDCGSMQSWSIYQYEGSTDKLELLPDGRLRHYTESNDGNNENDLLDFRDEHSDEKIPFFHDYIQGQYCLEKAYTNSSTEKEFLYAKICYPTKALKWTDTDFILHKVLNPLFRIISTLCLLLVAITYFVLPTLRDLIGNILTTMCLCLMIGQIASIVRELTIFSNHVSFLIADSVLYISLLGAYFWLCTFGYYIWKTFRSRNVFLRISDGQKYCWYSGYVWTLIFILTALAFFAHYFLDNPSSYEINNFMFENQQTIGWLGIGIFFSPVAMTILIDLFFILTTLKLINRRNVYGRIQNKLKLNFIMFTLIYTDMTVTWIFQILSWFNYDGLIYSYILVNAMMGPLIFYICIIHQRHVSFLLKKTCCYNESSTPTNDWGDELHYMNGGDEY